VQKSSKSPAIAGLFDLSDFRVVFIF